MTKLLAKAFSKASKLPNDLQDQLAQELMDEMQWESRLDVTFAKSQDKIDKLADKAAKEYKAGKTKPMGFDEL
jgi:hypothetical protein